MWTKPLGGGRTAALVVNTQNKDAGSVAVEATETSGGGHLQLVACNASRVTQRWALSPGVTPTHGAGAVTNVEMADGSNGTKSAQSWSIHACSTSPGQGIELAAQKDLPTKGCGANLCACNNAWEFFANDTIASAMDGQCLNADTTKGEKQ